ncbi:asparaginase [Halorarum halobium]|uniref:asparaginase n=1 Tax=Halorarum halobium TaxID=3075121 RepID=UPI0028AB99CF|nr:asparaginase [Halobaculum sp. XH14]
MADFRVRVLAAGGTIASEPGEGGATPAKAGDELVERVPELAPYADVSAENVASRPGFDMDFASVTDLAEAAERAVADGADGLVVTHGTDTLADTAFALSLGCDLEVPLVVTGSQRRFDEPGTDAPANLLTAVRAATDDRFEPGVHVAFDDELHPARDAVKRHTNALSTFGSPGKGPTATVTRGGIAIHREPRESAVSLPLSAAADDVSVPVVHSGTGVGSEPVERALATDADGIVVEGTGLGNVTGALGGALAEATSRVPVVVGTRCHAGPTEPVYGTAGGAVTLAEAGVRFAGDLSVSKARVALRLALAGGVDPDDVFDSPAPLDH